MNQCNLATVLIRTTKEKEIDIEREWVYAEIKVQILCHFDLFIYEISCCQYFLYISS